jgi:hypothetical protein
LWAGEDLISKGDLFNSGTNPLKNSIAAVKQALGRMNIDVIGVDVTELTRNHHSPFTLLAADSTGDLFSLQIRTDGSDRNVLLNI